MTFLQLTHTSLVECGSEILILGIKYTLNELSIIREEKEIADNLPCVAEFEEIPLSGKYYKNITF